MAVEDAYVFLGFLTPVLTLLFFSKPPTTFLTCFCRGERRKYARKKSRLNRGSNSQPPGHEFDTLITEPPGRGDCHLEYDCSFNASKGDYLDFSHLSELKNICITEIYMTKQYKSSIIKNHKISNKKKNTKKL